MILLFGLPRTGTTSISQALTDLGFKVLHHCPLTHDMGQEWWEGVKGDWDALASWKIIEAHQYYWRHTQPTHAIYSFRKQGWESSAESFGINHQEQKRLKNLAELTFRFYNKVIPTLKCEAKSLTYEELAYFLGIHTNLWGKIPHLNKSENFFSI